ncbi:uncharacterized protein B0H18DRAFT_1027868 [Fomitopsis serialis]|uniref:uncharacterized protein n=1 Tax=Fomitopsis serialis TaxID=139415 RepID=UPI002008A435|nr:uncharacterized protein B0H18DRAFT_1027868 [Neoantrodia serialis]KAH9919387.1 hypothetical protein B0H18DRAFT_1027868 [Neoantrodia serialis]
MTLVRLPPVLLPLRFVRGATINSLFRGQCGVGALLCDPGSHPVVHSACGSLWKLSLAAYRLRFRGRLHDYFTNSLSLYAASPCVGRPRSN